MDLQTRRLICINPNMFNHDLVSAAMALSAHGSLSEGKNKTTNGSKHKDLKEHKERLKDKKDKEKEGWEKLDILREFRCTHFPLVHALLQNPLKEFLSNVSPISLLSGVKDEKISVVGAPANPKDCGGLLFLFDGSVPNYGEDSIEWQTAKMSVKLIVYNPTTGTYKLKNNRADEGVVVMRRQTWQGKKALVTKTDGDGKQISRAWRKHEYKLVQREKFYKPSTDGGLVLDQIQRIIDYPVLVHYYIKTVDINRVNRKRKAKDEKDVYDKEDIQNSQQHPSKVAMTSLNSTPGSTVKQQAQVTNPAHSHTQAQNLSLSTSNSMVSVSTPQSLMLSNSLSNSGIGFDSMTALLDTPFDNLPEVELRLCNYSSMSIPMVAPTNIVAKVKTHAPEGGAWEDSTKVMAFVEGFKVNPTDKPSYYVRFDDLEVPAQEVGPGLIEFFAPPNTAPGVVFFWVVCRPLAASAAQYSNPTPFYYYPSDSQGHLRLEFHNLISPTEDADVANEERKKIVNRFKHYVRELDLSNNRLTDLSCCAELSKLHTLIADNNKLTSASLLPSLPNLKTFSVNFNEIDNLEQFIDNVEEAFPNLTYLSLIHNEACPYFSKMSHHYYNYRIYVISRLPNLLYLDSSIVTSEEQRHASCIMTDSLVNAN